MPQPYPWPLPHVTSHPDNIDHIMADAGAFFRLGSIVHGKQARAWRRLNTAFLVAAAFVVTGLLWPAAASFLDLPALIIVALAGTGTVLTHLDDNRIDAWTADANRILRDRMDSLTGDQPDGPMRELTEYAMRMLLETPYGSTPDRATSR